MSLRTFLPLAAFALLVPLAYGEPAPQDEHADKHAASKTATHPNKAPDAKDKKAAPAAVAKPLNGPAHALKHTDGKNIPPKADGRKPHSPDCHGKPDCPKHPENPLPPKP